MTEIIKIEKTNFNNKLINTVNARELHERLESKQDFSTWIKNRIEKYDFVENKDFISLHKFVEREIGGSKRIEYYISLDMAKELCMVENNEQGKRIRKYFIQCEENLKQQPQVPTNLKDALLLAYNQQCKIEEQQKEIKDKQETINLITTNSQERTYKKELRAS